MLAAWRSKLRWGGSPERRASGGHNGLRGMSKLVNKNGLWIQFFLFRTCLHSVQWARINRLCRASFHRFKKRSFNGARHTNGDVYFLALNFLEGNKSDYNLIQICKRQTREEPAQKLNPDLTWYCIAKSLKKMFKAFFVAVYCDPNGSSMTAANEEVTSICPFSALASQCLVTVG